MKDVQTGRTGSTTLTTVLALTAVAMLAPSVAGALSVEECTTLFERSPASQHCDTPEYKATTGEHENGCDIFTRCEVSAQVVLAATANGQLRRGPAQSMGTLCIGGSECGRPDGAIPRWSTENMIVCVRSSGTSYSLVTNSVRCNNDDISAADAVTYGVPTHISWARRNREVAIGLGDDSTNGALPIYRHGSAQACVDAWVDAPASEYCTASSTTNMWGSGGTPVCRIHADCSITADIFVGSTESLFAEDVTWLTSMGQPYVGWQPSEWNRSDIDDLEFCFSQTSTGNEDPQFDLTLKTRCDSGETSAGTAERDGLWTN